MLHRIGRTRAPLVSSFALLLPVLALPAWGGCVSGEGEPSVAGRTEAVVYGVDDRLDYYASTSTLYKEITQQAIAAMIRSDYVMGSGPFTFAGYETLDDYGSAYESGPMCNGERFASQPTMAGCSGTLIDDDLLLTAGHCVDPLVVGGNPCADHSWVFDYYYTAADTLASITSADVYGCAEVVTWVNNDSLDYAVVRLDRAVDASRQPVTVRATNTPLDLGQSITVIGFGTGLPAKIDEGGTVHDARTSTLDYFIASTDTFGGNSGSGVFTETGELVGILVRGAEDYVDGGGCTEVNVLPEDAADGINGGEDSTYAFNAVEALCATPEGDGRLLCGPWCQTCSSAVECGAGWDCLANPSDGATDICQAPCTSDADCRADHRCALADGRCVPDTGLACHLGDVWAADACGTLIELVEDCGSGSCIAGECRSGSSSKGKGCSITGAGAPSSGLPLLVAFALAALAVARRRLA